MKIEVTRTIELHEHICKACNTVFASEEFNGTLHCPKCKTTVRRSTRPLVEAPAAVAPPRPSTTVIGSKLRSIRKAKGWSQEHTASVIRGYATGSELVTGGYVSKVETNSSVSPPADTIALIRDWTLTTYNDLFGSNVANGTSEPSD